MYFQRLSSCSKSFSLRQSIHLYQRPSREGLIQQQSELLTRVLQESPISSSPCEQCYSTSSTFTSTSTNTKPHLSRSMQKWKKRKRKSKAQQKRELEALQKDFTQVLTSKFVKLVQENPHHRASCGGITTHNFTNSLTPYCFDVTEVITTGIGSCRHQRPGDDDFTKKLDAYFGSMMHPGEFDPLAYLSSVPAVDILSFVENRSLKQQLYKEKNPSVSKEESPSSLSHLVEAYLDKKLSDDGREATDNLSGEVLQRNLLEASSINPPLPKDLTHQGKDDESAPESFKEHNSTDRMAAPSLKDLQDKSKTVLSRLRKEADAPFNSSNDFFQFFLKFQEGLKKSGCVNRNWEDLVEEEEEGGLESKDPLGSSVDLESVEAEKDLGNYREDDTAPHLNDKVSSPKPIAVASPVEDEMGATHASEMSKKRKKKREHKDFQELIDKSFVDACCFTGNELLAVRNLEFQSNGHGISSVASVNRLIHALAKKQNLEAIKSLFSLLRQGSVSPTLQTYAGCLECVGRMAQPDSFLCERLLADVDKAGFDIGDVAVSCHFETDEWDYVFKAIRMVRPDFVPNPAPEPDGYNDHPMLSPLESDSPHRVESNQYAIDLSRAEVMERFDRQMEMEKQGVVSVPSIVASPPQAQRPSRETNKLTKLQEEVRGSWRQSLLTSFKEKLHTFEKKAQNNMNMTVYPYLKLFTPDVYVDIVFKSMQDLHTSSDGYSPTQATFQSSMGRAVNRRYSIQSQLSAGMADKVARLYAEFADQYLDKEFVLDNHRAMWLRAMSKYYDTLNLDMSLKKWPRHVTKMVGKFLLDLILYDLKIDANLFRFKSQPHLVPAFCTIYRPDVTTFTMAEIKVHPVVSRLFNMDTMEAFQFEPSTVPMLVPPLPWISRNTGGLLLGSYALVRSGDDLYHLDALQRVKDSQYTAVLDSLNTLSACAWKMNTRILDLQMEIFQAKGDANLKVSPPASVLPPLPTIDPSMSVQEKTTLYRQRVQLQHQKQDMHGLWCSDLYRLSIANKFRDEIFWFPHSMDFRGRTYPLPPHFNHLGSDNVRGMLLFAKGKPLGTKGHDWLKIHLVNLTGFKKRCSNEERLAYAHSLKDEILDSADYPLTGRKWWQSSDEPWQTLACCMELAQVERFEGDVEDYVCHFPVHQDGSCNGLQHYAAIGRDQAGAESVNLMPFDTPQDVYSDVVELVERERQKDAEEGHELAQALEGFIKRKVIKQTIMTTVYGVTRFGAKAQIHKQLKDIPEFPEELAWKASFYLTEKTFSCLREMFTATKDIQDWLTEAAQLIAALKPVDWVTPLGFPVVQPYFKPGSDLSRNKYSSKPNAVKQKNAFPPNYIHSLDSSHMMLTSLYCLHQGITFVSVHDCFWTHACDVPLMNQVCREQFVSLHQHPLLEDLSQHLMALVHNASNDPALQDDLKRINVTALHSLLMDLPKRGSFDLRNVLDSTYFFS